uniref:esterase OVCA2 n=1 Tax=Myxine glutinosa TaxID=7769 RepID=UPI0035902CBB
MDTEAPANPTGPEQAIGRMCHTAAWWSRRQNAQTFRERTGSLRKILKKSAEFVYISAPHVVPSLEVAEGEEAKKETDVRGWWFSKIDNSFCATDYVEICKGFEESLDEVGRAVKEHGPFDGVLGFSQGASLVSLLCGLQQECDQRFTFKFAILVAGFRSRSSPHNRLYSKGITLPSIHIFGDTDRVIPREMSEELLECFREPVVCTHSGGHFVPASPPQKKIYLNFLERFR